MVARSRIQSSADKLCSLSCFQTDRMNLVKPAVSADEIFRQKIETQCHPNVTVVVEALTAPSYASINKFRHSGWRCVILLPEAIPPEQPAFTHCHMKLVGRSPTSAKTSMKHEQKDFEP